MSVDYMGRRDFFKKAAGSAGLLSAAMAAPGPVRSYLLSEVSAQDALPVTGTPNVVVWTYRPDIVQDNLTIWADLNGQPAPQFADIPGVYDYANVIAAKFLGGEKIDMAYCHSDQLNRWDKAGWLRQDIEQIDWVQELKPALHPWGVENMSTFEGNMIGLPYWAGTKYLIYNDIHFEQAGIDAPPTTWEEFEEQCTQLQAAGIANPYIPYWRKDFWALGWSMFVESYSDGDYIFTDDYELTFKDGSTPFVNMLERWKRWYDAGIVPPDAFDIGDPTIRFNTGEHSFCMNDDYSHKRNNDPELSTIAGHAHNFLNPGTTHETTAISPMYVFGKNSNLEPETQNDLARFFAYRYTDGEYHVAMRWVLEEGLGTIDTNVMNDPTVRESFAEWRDVDIYDEQLALGKPRNVQKQLWYPEWEFKTIALVNEFVIGNKSLEDTLNEMLSNLEGAKAIYPTF
ncbi:MAG: carbohydrate ABC transporter substrate-binding protein [Thermomicrobiales bacterium]|nr:carbohydrate ABC transporter substrate-binding protein [Thermomicrobiales bacterium]